MQSVAIDNYVVTIRKHKWARKLTLSVKPDGSVWLTMPTYLPYFIGKNFIQEKKEWITATKQKAIQIQPEGTPPLTVERIKEYKKEAKQRIALLTDHFATLYGVTYNRICIKDQATRWGSCSRNRNLNFNWRIILAPEEVTKYVVIHEVCHLRQMNHSRQFWELVALTIPDYKYCRKWLRTEGRKLLHSNFLPE